MSSTTTTQPPPPTPHSEAPSETCLCPLCGAAETRDLYRGPGFSMGRCRGCGLVRQNPRLSIAQMHAGYRGTPDSGRTVRRIHEDDTLESWQTQPQLAYERGVATVVERRLRAGAKGLWIDVGCASGAVLVAARAAGFSVAGVELGEGQAALCREVHGIDAFHGTFIDARFPDRAAEVVSYRHVLEHIHDPIAELADVRRVLADDGLLLIEVPNYAGLRYRNGRVRTAMRLCRPFWERVNVPEHVFYFTPKTLRALLAKAGFCPLWWTTYGRTRLASSPLRRLYERVRDRLRVGNKIRLIARKA
jgi:SAM-dependent methyltransferase